MNKKQATEWLTDRAWILTAIATTVFVTWYIFLAQIPTETTILGIKILTILMAAYLIPATTAFAIIRLREKRQAAKTEALQ